MDFSALHPLHQTASRHTNPGLQGAPALPGAVASHGTAGLQGDPETGVDMFMALMEELPINRPVPGPTSISRPSPLRQFFGGLEEQQQGGSGCADAQQGSDSSGRPGRSTDSPGGGAEEDLHSLRQRALEKNRRAQRKFREKQKVGTCSGLSGTFKPKTVCPFETFQRYFVFHSSFDGGFFLTRN